MVEISSQNPGRPTRLYSYHVFLLFSERKTNHFRTCATLISGERSSTGCQAPERGSGSLVIETRRCAFCRQNEACLLPAGAIFVCTCTKVGHRMLHRLGHYFTTQPSRKHTYLHKTFV